MLVFLGLFGVAIAGALALSPLGPVDADEELQDHEEPNSTDDPTVSLLDALPPDSLELRDAPYNQLAGKFGDDVLVGTDNATPSEATQYDADLIFGVYDGDTLPSIAHDMSGQYDAAATVAMGHYEGTPVIPVIKDFDPNEDEIELLYDPSRGAANDMTTVTDGTDLIVQCDGAPVARLAGMTSIDMALIHLVPSSTS